MDSIRTLREITQRDGVEGRIVQVLVNAANLVGEDFSKLEEELFAAGQEAPGNLKNICSHIIESRGKHIRPLLCLLAFRACGGKGALPMDLASTCELIHDATLLHDDVIDEGDARRGIPTARIRYSNSLSVLGGDYLLIKAVEKVASRDTVFMKSFLETMNCIVEGELAQLQLRGSIDTTEEQYFQIIQGKTASLFRWSVLSGALAAGAPNEDYKTAGKFGYHVGISFQLMDDALDFTADPAVLGKSLLADIGEGKMTLPVILAIKRSPSLKLMLHSLQVQLNNNSYRQGNLIASQISHEVISTGSVDTVKKFAAEHTEIGLAALKAVKSGNAETVEVISDLASALLERGF